MNSKIPLFTGKTTLLNVLNYRNRGNLKISGDIKVNGQLIDSTAALSSISGYVQQEDLFIGTLKVKELLKFQVNVCRNWCFKSTLKLETL